jgi:hypothetical protein
MPNYDDPMEVIRHDDGPVEFDHGKMLGNLTPTIPNDVAHLG